MVGMIYHLEPRTYKGYTIKPVGTLGSRPRYWCILFDGKRIDGALNLDQAKAMINRRIAREYEEATGSAQVPKSYGHSNKDSAQMCLIP